MASLLKWLKVVRSEAWILKYVLDLRENEGEDKDQPVSPFDLSIFWCFYWRFSQQICCRYNACVDCIVSCGLIESLRCFKGTFSQPKYDFIVRFFMNTENSVLKLNRPKSSKKFNIYERTVLFKISLFSLLYSERNFSSFHCFNLKANICQTDLTETVQYFSTMWFSALRKLFFHEVTSIDIVFITPGKLHQYKDSWQYFGKARQCGPRWNICTN